MHARSIIGWGALAAGIATIAGWSAAAAWRPSREHFALQGVDVSDAAGAIDWHEVKADGADFAYVRATSGADRRDARFASNWADVEEAGLRRGAIHHFSLCRLASDQASNFLRTVPRDAAALPAAVELTLDPDCAPPAREVVVQEVARLVAAIETHTGKPALLKVDRGFERAYTITAAIARPIWSSQLAFPPDYAARPWRMWQANPARHVNGAEQPIGWDVVAP